MHCNALQVTVDLLAEIMHLDASYTSGPMGEGPTLCGPFSQHDGAHAHLPHQSHTGASRLTPRKRHD